MNRNKIGNVVFTRSCISTDVVSMAFCENAGIGEDGFFPVLFFIPISATTVNWEISCLKISCDNFLC